MKLRIKNSELRMRATTPMDRRAVASQTVSFAMLVAVAMALGALVRPTAHAAAAVGCQELAALSVPGATITATQVVAAGAFAPAGGGRGAGRGGASPFARLSFACVAESMAPNSRE
ncbi:MAG: hypothetical protein A3H97_17315 [Acidobacteria bacterium RIFCSPLOWO2_02_FULL_65_29]|nr:MAG: hypothetical protein A3H97_17315 [Acidobacteria bacterium RIFCSPLOWO2_02_FULL_65_29]